MVTLTSAIIINTAEATTAGGPDPSAVSTEVTVTQITQHTVHLINKSRLFIKKQKN